MLSREVVILYNNIERIINDVGIPTGEIPNSCLSIEEAIDSQLISILLGVNAISGEIAKFCNLVEILYYTDNLKSIPNEVTESINIKTREYIISLKNEIIHRMYLQLAAFDKEHLSITVLSDNDDAIKLINRIRNVVDEYFKSAEITMDRMLDMYSKVEGVINSEISSEERKV